MKQPGERVVLAPNLIAGALFDADDRTLLEYWNEGRIVPVVTRSLLDCYIRLLFQMGVGQKLASQWVQWFTHGDKSLYFEASEVNTTGAPGICARAAEIGNAAAIIYDKRWRPFDLAGARWISAGEWIKAHPRK